MSLTDEEKRSFTERLKVFEERLIEQMRKMQTEILRSFKAPSDRFTIRLCKIET
jgi:hypothetical protein